MVVSGLRENEVMTVAEDEVVPVADRVADLDEAVAAIVWDTSFLKIFWEKKKTTQ